MDSESLKARRALGAKVTRAAGALGQEHLKARANLTVQTKGAQDFVSEADREVETLIRGRLHDAFPGDGFLGEEGGAVDASAESVWVVDPIDGTTNFLHGLPLWSVSVALVHRGEIELGFIYDPSHDQLFSAQRGKGAYLDGEPLQVRSEADPGRAVIGVGYNATTGVGAFTDRLTSLLETGFAFRRFGSAAIGLAWTAAGRLDGFWQLQLHPWDVMAGLLLVAEAGGQRCDFLASGPLGSAYPCLAGSRAIARPLSAATGIDLI